MPSSTTTNMGLIVPTVGQEPGPNWANDLNANLGVLDQHNHSSGQGVKITPSGINISSDLPFNDNNATTLKTIRFQSQSGSLSGVAPNLGCVYVAGNELYYNDVAGNVVQITNSGSVNAGAGSITGLPSGTASASYSAGTFIWQSATNTPANMDAASYVYRNNAANSKGLTLSPPNAMASDYSVTLPTLPGATSFLTLDTSGNMSPSISTSLGIVGSNIANSTITQSKLTGPISSATVSATFSGGAGTYSYTVPSGFSFLYVIACGGGGGGAGGNSATVIANVVGGGAGAGAPVWEGIIPVTGGVTYTVTIGAGGTNGQAGPVGNNSSSGAAGGSTSFGSILVTPGGAGGSAPPSWNTSTVGTGGSGRSRAGGRGGSGSVGAGGSGGSTYLLDLYDGAGGNGGSSNGVNTGGGGGAGGGSIGAGGAGGTGHGGMGAGTSGGGGGAGGGGLTPFKGDDGAAGGDGYMIIYIV